MNRSTLVATALPLLGVAALVAVVATPRAADAGAPDSPAVAAAGQAATPGPAAVDAAAQIAQGQHLVMIGACNDCHTPMKMGAQGPEPDMERMLSGHPEGLPLPPAPAASGPWVVAANSTGTAWAGPWGTSFTANLTPDADTGLGEWTVDTFRDTIRNGRHLGRGRALLPPMPWPMYKHMSDEELAAVFAYLQSIPAVKNKVPEPLPPPGAPSAEPAPAQ